MSDVTAIYDSNKVVAIVFLESLDISSFLLKLRTLVTKGTGGVHVRKNASSTLRVMDA